MKLIGTRRLETERLVLRKVTVNDAEIAYKNWCSSDNVCKYVLWDKHSNVEETKKLYENWEKEYFQNDTFRWIVELKKTQEVIGTIDVVSKKYIKFGSFEIGYCYGEKFWGNGYGTEALKAVIKYLFEKVEADIIFAEYMSDNVRSGRVMEKAGMKYEGEVRGRVLDKNKKRNNIKSYSISKDEYFNNIYW